MNRTYRTLFNRALGAWQAVAETARARGKGDRGPARAACVLAGASALVLAAIGGPQAVMAQAVVVEGNVSPGGATSPNWNIDGDLIVGNDGYGSLTIEDGGTVTSTDGYIGSGVVTVSGAGSSWDNSFNLVVGHDGDYAELTIEDGGTVTNIYGYIGHNTTSAVTVSGDDSLWTNTDQLYVGLESDGELTIEDGGTVSSVVGYIGYRSGSTGSVTVTGADSSWANSRQLYVGHQGDSTGTLNIGAVAGEDATAPGMLETDTVYLGNGTGRLVFNHNADDYGFEADLVSGGDGSHAIDHRAGSTTLSGDNEGFTGDTIISGGTLRAGDASAFANATDYTIDGGTLDLNSYDLTMSSLSGDGGEVILGSANLIVDQGDVTEYAGDISGGGSLIHQGGGTLTLMGETELGGDVIVDGGELRIADGGSVTNDEATIGSGTVTVTGENSEWINEGSGFFVGQGGSGELTIADGGRVTSTHTAIGAFHDSSGTATIGAAAGEDATAPGVLETDTVRFGDGDGRLVFNHTADDYRFEADLVSDSDSDSSHVIGHYAGTTILSGNSTNFSGETTVNGGTLIVADTLGGSAEVAGGRLQVDGTFAGDVEADGDGMVSGTGTIAGDLVVADGTLSGFQGQTLAVDGDLTLDAGSRVDVALGGAPSDALFDVGGDLVLDGTLNVADQGGFGVGVYRLFDYQDALDDNGLAIGSTPAGVNANELSLQTATANQVNLVSTVGMELGFWDGGNTDLHDNDAIDGGSGVWRADGRNWTDADGELNGPYQPNPTFAVFQAEAGTVSVDDEAGAISATGMQFATDGYRIEGDAIALEGAGGESIIRVGDGTGDGAGMTATIASELTGDSALITSDLGTLVLEGDNTYTGGTEIRDGVLSVSSDANLGHEDGDLTFAGGTLATTDSFDSTRDVALSGNGRFDVADDTTLGLSGEIAGSGDLRLAGHGTLELTGTNDYGNTVVEAGTLRGNVEAISGDIANAGTVVFDQGGDDTFTGDIVGFDGDAGGMIKQGDGTLTLAGTSTLDWTVEAGGLVSASDRFGGDLEIDKDASFTFDQANDGHYAGTISGDGELRFSGGGSVELTGDSHGYTGTTAVDGTTLTVNDTFGGSLAVGNDGRLQGDGTVGATTLANDATIAPGNSIGELTVDGDLTFDAGSSYEVEVDPTGSDSDHIHVTGTAYLDGSVAHIGESGDYDPESTYRILSAEGGLDGEFDDVSSTFAFLDAALEYDTESSLHGVDLTLTRN
ncbi:autotransporter outer membrane beta-barrel domain-containing protein, partial [Billgrantia endophytica]